MDGIRRPERTGRSGPVILGANMPDRKHRQKTIQPQDDSPFILGPPWNLAAHEANSRFKQIVHSSLDVLDDWLAAQTLKQRAAAGDDPSLHRMMRPPLAAVASLKRHGGKFARYLASRYCTSDLSM